MRSTHALCTRARAVGGRYTHDSADSQHNRRKVASALGLQLPFGTGRHYLRGGVAGRVIGGWDLSGTGLARTGLPINIVVTRSAANMLDGNSANQRPDLVPGVSIIPAGGQTINQWWNIAAFAVPAKNTWGNSGRYIARAPSLALLPDQMRRGPRLK